MAEGVEIVIKPRHIERVVYSLVIIALAVLLIIKWTGGSCTIDDNQTAVDVDEQAGLNETNETSNASVEPGLCSNGVKDQDETDVDCGGDDCDPCGEYEECHEDSDCETEYCMRP